MSALLRPHGDEIATVYGPYKTKKEVKKIAKGDKLDILCSDGLNYHVEVKEIAANQGRLHFRHWSVKYDYIGSFEVLYLANQGMYSEGISAQNTYPVKRETGGEKVKSSVIVNVDASSKNFPSGTRYPEDFLGKPRYPTTNSRKRSTEEIEDDGRKKNKRVFIEGIGLVKYVPAEDGSEISLEVTDENKEEAVDAGKIGEDYKPIVKGSSDSKNTIRTKKLPSEKKDSKQLQVVQSSFGTNNDRVNGKFSPSSSSSSSSPSSSRPQHRLIASEVEIDDEVSQTSSKIGEPLIALMKERVSSGTISPDEHVTANLSSSMMPQPDSHHGPFVPSFLEIQRTGQLENLREVLGTDRAMTDTGRAIEIVTNHPIIFSRSVSIPGDRQPKFNAKQLLELLYARRKIDEVIQHILSTLA